MVNGDERIDALEIRLMHQDKTIAELNDVIAAQWKAIDSLQRKFRQLSEEIEAAHGAEAPPIQKPPHY